jgi:hypothetical protein
MTLEPDRLGARMLLDRSVIGGVAIADEVQRVIRRAERQHAVQRAGGRTEVPTPPGAPGSSLSASFLCRRAAPGAGVRSGVESIDEPRTGAHGRGDA